jgi:hypothetical protein
MNDLQTMGHNTKNLKRKILSGGMIASLKNGDAMMQILIQLYNTAFDIVHSSGLLQFAGTRKYGNCIF